GPSSSRRGRTPSGETRARRYPRRGPAPRPRRHPPPHRPRPAFPANSYPTPDHGYVTTPGRRARAVGAPPDSLLLLCDCGNNVGERGTERAELRSPPGAHSASGPADMVGPPRRAGPEARRRSRSGGVRLPTDGGFAVPATRPGPTRSHVAGVRPGASSPLASEEAVLGQRREEWVSQARCRDIDADELFVRGASQLKV